MDANKFIKNHKLQIVNNGIKINNNIYDTLIEEYESNNEKSIYYVINKNSEITSLTNLNTKKMDEQKINDLKKYYFTAINNNEYYIYNFNSDKKEFEKQDPIIKRVGNILIGDFMRNNL